MCIQCACPCCCRALCARYYYLNTCIKILKFYENWNFLNFLKILSFWIFLKSYEIFESFEILWKFWIFKKIFEILWNFWNFEIKKKNFNLNFSFFLWNFLTYWLAKSYLCAIKNHIALSCHVISFIYFARDCNMIIYCTAIAFC